MSRRVILAGGWVIASHAGSQILRLASNLIMTRLLVPDLFGLMALANTILFGLVLFSDLGLQSKRCTKPTWRRNEVSQYRLDSSNPARSINLDSARQ